MWSEGHPPESIRVYTLFEHPITPVREDQSRFGTLGARVPEGLTQQDWIHPDAGKPLCEPRYNGGPLIWTSRHDLSWVFTRPLLLYTRHGVFRWVTGSLCYKII